MRKKIIVLLMSVGLILNGAFYPIVVNANEFSGAETENTDNIGEEYDEKEPESENISVDMTSDEAQKTDCANSWRYKNGVLLDDIEENIATFSGRARSVIPWSNINGEFFNSFGDKIEGVVAKGIDVSEHNGNIDWERVKNTDVNYAILRCGYGDDFSFQDDKKWNDNVSKCEEVGMPYGVYIYSYATSVEQAQSEAQHVLRLVNGHNLSYPIYLDLEEESVRKSVSKEEIAQIAKTFCDIIQSRGYKVGIYANTDWFNTYLTNSQFDNYIKWVAQYNYECEYQGIYTMWQCTSKGRVDGITGDVDLNMDFGTTSGSVNNNGVGVSCNISDDVYTIGSALDNSKILSVEGASKENHKKIVLDNNSNIEGHKQFEIKKVKNGWYRIEVGSTGKVLEIPNDSEELENSIEQGSWNGGDGQLWRFIAAGDGYYYIKSKIGTYLELKEANITEGNYIQTNALNQSDEQKWKLDITTYERTIDDGTYVIGTEQGKALDLCGGSLSDGENIQIFASNNSAAQKYEITYMKNGYYKIIVEKSGKSLDVAAASKENGTNLQQYEWNGTDAQLWRFIDVGDGSYYIKSKLGTVLDVWSGQMIDRTNVWMYELNETDAQKWNLKNIEEYPVQEGVYSIRSGLSTNKVLDIWAASLNDGANVQLYTSNKTDAQKFKLSYAGSGFYTITSVSSGKVLDVYGASTKNGANVQQYTSNNSDAQLWKFVDIGNGKYYIRSKLGKMLDVYAANTMDGSNIQLYEANGSNAQLWGVKRVEKGNDLEQPVEDGSYIISSSINNNKVLDLYAGSLSNRANIQIYTFNNTLAQKYKITYMGEGYYKIIIQKSGKALDVYGASEKPGANVQQYEWNGTDAQLWKFIEAGEGYYYIQSKLGTVLDLWSGKIEDGTNVWMYSLNKTKAQKWKLRKL